MLALRTRHEKNIALAMLGDTRSPPAYRLGGVWLLCSFQGPSEKVVSRRRDTVVTARAHGLSKLNSMHRLDRDGMSWWPAQVRSTC